VRGQQGVEVVEVVVAKHRDRAARGARAVDDAGVVEFVAENRRAVSPAPPTPGPRRASAGSTVALAWKPLENSSAASRPLKAASRSSTASVISRVPVTRREAGAPAPWRCAHSAARALSSGCCERPR
jgi:hypothetical protein